MSTKNSVLNKERELERFEAVKDNYQHIKRLLEEKKAPEKGEMNIYQQLEDTGAFWRIRPAAGKVSEDVRDEKPEYQTGEFQQTTPVDVYSLTRTAYEFVKNGKSPEQYWNELKSREEEFLEEYSSTN